MYEFNQTHVADSFLALFSANGHPTLGRKEMEARHEVCEDLAQQVAELCRHVQFKDDLSEDAALRKCLDGLLSTPETVGAVEARWVIQRVAELLGWEVPPWLASPATDAQGRGRE